MNKKSVGNKVKISMPNNKKSPSKRTISAKKSKSSKSIHKKPQISKETSKTRKEYLPISSFTKKVISIGIIVCAAVVLMWLIVNTYYEPSKVAERKLEALAMDYYENYYYDKFVNSLGDVSIEDAIAEQDGTGFATVPLRHLLLFDNQRDAGYETYFNNLKYVCDKNNTTIKIYPDAPYGKKDYHVEYNISCKYK